MNWETLAEPVFHGRLCMTLLHSVWQVAALAVMAWGLARLRGHRSAAWGYALHVAALLLAMAAVPITYGLVDVHVSKPVQGESRLPAGSTARVPVSLAFDETPPTAVEVERTPNPRPRSAASDVAMSAPVAAERPEPSTRWLRVSSWAVGVYAIGVLVMLVRFFRGVWYANRLRARAKVIRRGPVYDVFSSLARRCSMRVMPVLARAERIMTPKVVGAVRPTILLPAAAITGLSSDELEMILAHELAHVWRLDMWVNLLQRLAEVMLFFNPALWYLSRRISTLREYCCDEFSCQAMSTAAVERRARYASALVQLVELERRGMTHSGHEPFPETSDLVALGTSCRSPSALRRRVARLVGEPLDEPVRFSRCGLLALAVVAAVLLVAPTSWLSPADSAPAESRADRPNDRTEREREGDADKSVSTPSDAEVRPGTGKIPAEPPARFELQVVGPGGQPVPHAMAEIRTGRTGRKRRAEQLRQGEFVREGPYGVFFKADGKGRLVIELPDKPKRFNVAIHEPGYGPYWAAWDSSERPQPMPSRFTAELDAGWTVGGVIVNSEGVPIQGAAVHPNVKYKKRPGDLEELHIGTKITTDASGRWRFASVPVSMNDVFVEISHPEYEPNRRSLTRSEFGLEAGDDPKAKITLQQGLDVIGSVSDDSGRPIAGAVLRTEFVNDLRRATTDPDGRYRLVGCESRMARIVVSAPGKAVDCRDVHIEPDMEPVDFVMKPGGRIRVRVLDHQGHPIPRARIFFQRWRGPVEYFEFDHVDQRTDENGVWQWDEAPLDEIKADICPPGGMQLLEQPLVAGEEERVFRLPPPLVISGDVTDTATGQPIERFRVVPGSRSGKSNSLRLSWARSESFEAVQGQYELRPNRGYQAHVVRIEADGYRTAVSRDIGNDEGQVRVDFELKPADDVAATIVTPTGEPAAKAQVALGIAGSQIKVQNGRIHDRSTYVARHDADDSGQFRFPSQGADFQIVITHPSGFAHLKSTDGPVPRTVHLTPWARVEGAFRVGQQTVANVDITLMTNSLHSYGPDVPNIFTSYEVTTAANGRFAFERVFPGDGRIGRRILFMARDGAMEVTSSERVPVRCESGETLELNLGGTGRPVTGRLVPPADFRGRVLWNFAEVTVRVDLPQPERPPQVPEDPERREAWWEQWKATEEGQAWQRAQETYLRLRSASPYFIATVDHEGFFRIDDVPAGDFVLDVSFAWHPPGYLTGYRFSVPETDRPAPDQLVELGVVRLESK